MPIVIGMVVGYLKDDRMGRLSFSDTRHLVARTALGQQWDGVKALQGKTRVEAVHILLKAGSLKTPPAPR